MFIFLLVIPFCKGADPDESWKKAMQSKSDFDKRFWSLDLSKEEITDLPENLSLSRDVKELDLAENLIRALPELNLPYLELLDLSDNLLDYVNPDIIQQLPRVQVLNLRGNKRLTQENVNALEEKAAARTGRYKYVRILADPDLPTNIKGSEE